MWTLVSWGTVRNSLVRRDVGISFSLSFPLPPLIVPPSPLSFSLSFTISLSPLLISHSLPSLSSSLSPPSPRSCVTAANNQNFLLLSLLFVSNFLTADYLICDSLPLWHLWNVNRGGVGGVMGARGGGQGGRVSSCALTCKKSFSWFTDYNFPRTAWLLCLWFWRARSCFNWFGAFGTCGPLITSTASKCW